MQLQYNFSKTQTWLTTNRYMYNMYKLSYKKPIFNSLVIIIQLIDMTIYLLILLSHSWSILFVVHVFLFYDLLVSDGTHHDF